jgi:predicted nucleic acid-binding protein
MSRASSKSSPIGKNLYVRAVLIDTGALLAQANKKDEHHQEAVECFEKIAKLHLAMYISLPTIYETQRRFLYDLTRGTSDRFLMGVFDGKTNILRTEAADEVAAVDLISRCASFDLTLTDAVNMALMDRIGIGAAFSFDNHFLQAGFIRIPPIHL